MRAYRKRPWAPFVVNMTPLIDVVFLIIIFFIIMINFSEMHIRNVILPRADEAQKSLATNKLNIPITIKSEDSIFWEREEVQVRSLPDLLARIRPDPDDITVQIRADENVPYDVIRQIMLKLALARVNKIEFSTWKETPEPLTGHVDDEE